MGELTVIQMMYRQRRAEEFAARQSEKPDVLVALFAGCLIFLLLVVLVLFYAITLLAKALLFPFRLARVHGAYTRQNNFR